MRKKNKVLLIGGSGTLGSSIIKLKVFKNLHYPKKKKLDLLNKLSIRKYLAKKYDIIINCAAIARMKECETKPLKAIKVNIFGVLNLVNEVKNYETNNKKKIRLIHISTDGVYESTKGNYTENSIPKPYNVYSWTKLCSEELIKLLSNYIIIRTRFFNKKKIRFKTAATDIYTSMMEVNDLVKEIKHLSLLKFVGTINVVEKKKSDYLNYKNFKPNIKKCKRKDIIRELSFKIAKDASMNLSLLNMIKKKK